MKPEFALEQPSAVAAEKYDIYSLVINELYANSEKIIISQASKSQPSIDLFQYSPYYENLLEVLRILTPI
ncbi:MAG: hypothetical protein AB8B72_13630 [Crocinitomicaceae bacterium]